MSRHTITSERKTNPLNKGQPMKISIRLAAMAWAAAALTPALAVEPYAIWDDFSSPGINMSKWLGTERIRIVQDGTLRVLQRDLGNQVDNVGVFNSSYAANLKDPAAITQMRAFVTVTNFNVTGCAANTTERSAVQARVIGSFFNGGAVAPTSRIGDVMGLIRMIRNHDSTDPAGELRVEGVIAQCTTADCNYGTISLGSADLGTAPLGSKQKLALEWEPANNRFSFYRGNNPAVRVSYAVPDSLAPYLPFKQVGTRTFVANCLAGPRTEALIDARFDDIAVNASAAP